MSSKMSSKFTDIRYDGTFSGLLTVIYECYTAPLLPDRIACHPPAVGTLFDMAHAMIVETNDIAAQRVYQGIVRRGGRRAALALYKAFLSEVHDKEQVIYNYLQRLFRSQGPIDDQLHNEHVWRIDQLNQLMSREERRIIEHVRFQRTRDGIYFSAVDPDLDVLPLIGSHFLDHYRKKDWIIYDIGRKYGIHFDGQELHTIVLDLAEEVTPGRLPSTITPTDEPAYSKLWKEYFSPSPAAKPRDIKLHVRRLQLKDKSLVAGLQVA